MENSNRQTFPRSVVKTMNFSFWFERNGFSFHEELFSGNKQLRPSSPRKTTFSECFPSTTSPEIFIDRIKTFVEFPSIFLAKGKNENWSRPSSVLVDRFLSIWKLRNEFSNRIFLRRTNWFCSSSLMFSNAIFSIRLVFIEDFANATSIESIWTGNCRSSRWTKSTKFVRFFFYR